MTFTPAKQLLSAAFFVSMIGSATADIVTVPGSSARYETAMEVQAAGKPVRLTLTGAAMRRKAFFNVYAVASYLQDGVAAKSAEQLAAADGVKLLYLVMERDVGGRDMAEAITAGVRGNYPGESFSAELKKVGQVLGSIELKKGDHVKLTALPRVGLRCEVVGKIDVTIENPGFAKAIWDIYLGKQNLGETVKSGLVSRQ